VHAGSQSSEKGEKNPQNQYIKGGTDLKHAEQKASSEKGEFLLLNIRKMKGGGKAHNMERAVSRKEKTVTREEIGGHIYLWEKKEIFRI